jgi:hypothetical protein
MRKQNPLLCRSPGKKRFIVDSRQAGVLRTNHIDVRAPPQQRAENVVIEILVGQPAQGYLGSRHASVP